MLTDAGVTGHSLNAVQLDDRARRVLQHCFSSASRSEISSLNHDGRGRLVSGSCGLQHPRDGLRQIRQRTAGADTETIATDRGRFSRFGDPTIDAAGQVGFEARLSRVTGEGIFRAAAGRIVQVAGTRDAGDFDFVNAGPSIGRNGNVAFIGERIVGSQFIDGVYAGRGGPVRAVYDTTGAFSDFHGNPALNGSGTVAFLADLKNGTSGVFVGNGGGSFVTVADDTGPLVASFGFSDPSLNERGDVAFRAGTNIGDPGDNGAATGSGIFVSSGGTLRTVLQGGFDTIASLGDPSLNDRGDVAFILEPDFGRQLLLTGADPVADRVVGTGDTLLGRTVAGIAFSREGLNDSGQLAFTAVFEDGSAAVVLATPVDMVQGGLASPVPEPAPWLLFACGCLAAVAIRRDGAGRTPVRRLMAVIGFNVRCG